MGAFGPVPVVGNYVSIKSLPGRVVEMLRGTELLIILLMLVPIVWALTDILGTPTRVWAESNQNQGLWTVVVFLLPLLGPLLYLVIARPTLNRARAGGDNS